MSAKHGERVFLVILLLLIICFPSSCFGSLESSLLGLKTKLTGVILPVISVIGLGFAAMSLFTGNPQAKQHIVYAIAGCIFGFGAQAIVDFIGQTVR